MVISQKRCNVVTFLLQTINRKAHEAYLIAAIPITLSDF